METINITERKKKYTADLIISVILLIAALFYLIKWSAPLAVTILIVAVLLLVPLFVLSGYVYDVSSKIQLSKEAFTISYGRSIMDIVHFEGNFTIPPDTRIAWHTIADFHLETYTQESAGGSDGTSAATTNHYLIIVLINQDFSNPYSTYRRSIRLRRFNQSPGEILELCKHYKSKQSVT